MVKWDSDLPTHHVYLLCGAVPVLRFEYHTQWFLTFTVGTSDTPCDFVGFVSVGFVVTISGVEWSFAVKMCVFAQRTVVHTIK